LLSMSLSPCCPYHPAEVFCRIGQAAPVHAAFARQQWARPSELNLSGPPMGSLALRPGDSLTTPWAALSISFRMFGFPPSCDPSYGAPDSCPGGTASR
jgi:hypothetical protein